MTTAIATVAGGAPDVAIRLGVAMFALQASIGTANDLLDEAADRMAKPVKPLPLGLISRRLARVLLAVALLAGLSLAALSGVTTLAVAVLGTADGLVYDRWLKGTAWSWLPFAIGIPLLPVFAWLGVAGELPAAFGWLIPAAVIGGAGLAVANQLADLERDRAAGTETTAVRLGPGRAWTVIAVLQAVVGAIAAISVLTAPGRGAGLVGVALGGVVIAAGVVASRGASPARRERAWELQAIGLGLLGAGWVGALAEGGVL